MDDMKRPYITLVENPDRPLSEEHHDAVQLMVIEALRDFNMQLLVHVDQMIRDIHRTRSERELDVSARIMEKAYFTTLYGKLRLVGPAEVVEFLELSSKQRLNQMRKAPSLKFPDPVAELKMGPVWLASDIEAWEPTWKRKRGHPPKEE